MKSMITTGVAFFFGGTAYAYRSGDLEISQKRLRLRGLRRNLRVVAVSDLHAPCRYSSAIDLVDTVNRAQPDLFILAGDIIGKRGDESLIREFDGIEAKVAKLATLGNHEYNSRLRLWKVAQEYRRAGISLLVNDGLEACGLNVLGLDDLVKGRPDYRLVNGSKGAPTLVVSHCPESFDLMKGAPESRLIVLSGHTHGGQIAPFGYPIVTPPGSGSYVQGWYRKKSGVMYVMRGIGTSGPDIRIGARPEMLMLDLIKA